MSLEEFIKSQIESVDELRALLLLQSAPPAEWDASEAAGKLYLQPEKTMNILQKLAGKGLLARIGESGRFRYGPQTPELAALVEQLVELDRAHPVTLINMIYGRPRDIEAFAEAFKLRKKPKN